MNVVIAGHLCLDVIPRWETGGLLCIKPGSTIRMEELTFSTGGAVSNTGIALKRLGFEPILMARLGDDYVGSITRQILEEEGIKTDSFTSVHGVPSSYTIVLNPPKTDRIFLHHPGPNDLFSADDVQLSGLEPGLFHLGYPPVMRQLYIDGGRNLEVIYRSAKEQGWITSLDLAVPDPNSDAGQADWHGILARTLPYVDLFLPSLDELLLILDPGKFEAVNSGELPISVGLLNDLGVKLLELGAGVVVIKLGDSGLYLRTGDRAGSLLGEEWAYRQLLSPVFKVQVQGTTGAGDATIAGFLVGVLLQEGPSETLTLANAVGGCCVETLSATAGLPSLDVVKRRIKQCWTRVSPVIDCVAWVSDELGILHGPLDQVKLD